MKNKDIAILRDLAKQVMEISKDPVQDQRRDLWRKHNSLQRTRPPVLVRWNLLMPKVFPDTSLVCSDLLLRDIERKLRQQIFHFSIGDDCVIEPWLSVRAAFHSLSGPYRWGPKIETSEITQEGGSFHFKPCIKGIEDLALLAKPTHEIDEEITRTDFEKVQEAIGDIIDVIVDRTPVLSGFFSHIVYDMVHLLGLEELMWDLIDKPEFVHQLAAFMSNGILDVQNQAEANGDYTLSAHFNQSMPYALELPDPKDGGNRATRKQLWIHMEAQEFQSVSPEMLDEFILRYQIPIMEKYGLVAYGCCEDLTQKIKYLRKIPNLRRIAVTPWADLRKCAEQIGKDYVLSWRPNPSDHISQGLDRAFVEKSIKGALSIFKEYGCYGDITLKDIITVGGNNENLAEWAKIVKNTIEDTI